MTNLGEIRVAFSYKGNERQKTFITVKNINGDILIQSSVKRSVHDPHDKILARFFVFKKAMNQLVLRNLLTKAQRKEAWRLYKSTVRLPSKINLDSRIKQEVNPLLN